MRASESDRALVCPASLVLPRPMDQYERTKTKEAAGLGKILHYWKETGKLVQVEESSEKDLETATKKVVLSKADRVKYWPPGTGQHEVTFAINLKDARLHLFDDYTQEVGALIDADQWKKLFDPKQYLTGSIDWLDWGGPDRRPWVDDLKTGSWPPDPATSKQLRSYLLVPWIKDGMKTLGWKGVLTITHWPKYRLDGKPKRSKAVVFSGLQMMEHLDDLRWAVDSPGEVNPLPDEYDDEGNLVEMSKCVFCPCREETAQTSWMQHYRYRAMDTCMPGIIKRIWN